MEQKNDIIPLFQHSIIPYQHNMVLITGNTKHFMHIPGLKMEDWIHG